MQKRSRRIAWPQCSVTDNRLFGMAEFNLKIPEKIAQERNRRAAMATTVTLHVAALLVMVFTQCASPTKPPEELAEIEWGGSGGAPNVDAPAGPAMRGTPVPQPKPQQATTTQKTETTTQPKTDPQKVEVPKTTNTPSRETIPATTAKPTKPNTAPATNNTNSQTSPSSPSGTQGGQRPDGTGTTPAGGSGGSTSGYSVAGLGTRGWLTSPSARYPDEEDVSGVVVLRFTVMPDGSVTNIQPVRRAAASLVNAATAGLRKARARALPPNAPQVPQQGTITYTFKLK
ncbi:MAG: TonB family protein [Chlorobi bacterium CHB2]|nr:TonB family protein [Chlorobi bacterium CHB2]